MKKISNNKKMVIFVVIGVFVSIVCSFCLAETLIESSKVSYVDNSKIGATNVQNAIDGTCTKFSSELQNFLLKVYPVGSIYISYSATNPQTLFGGTWEVFGKGQTLVGIDTSSTEFKTLGQTGGAKSISYTPAGTIGSTGLNINQIPSHTHSYDKVNANTGSHTLTIDEIPSHNHGGSTGISAVNISTQFGYASGTDGRFISLANGNTYNGALNIIWNSSNHSHTISSQGGGGGHTHPISTTSTSTGAAGKGTTSDGHTHSFTGTATTLNNLQPYITVYMWKRTK